MRQDPKLKKLDREIERLYKAHADRLSINMMDIRHVFAAGHAAAAVGASIEAAVRAAIATYCVKGL
jgi:hypothetical protein